MISVKVYVVVIKLVADSADQLSRFYLDSQEIDHFVKDKMKKIDNGKNNHKKTIIVKD